MRNREHDVDASFVRKDADGEPATRSQDAGSLSWPIPSEPVGGRALLALAVKASDAPGFAPYRQRAAEYTEAVAADFSRLAGGHLGAAACSFIESAALELAAGRYLYDCAAALATPCEVDGQRVAPDAEALATVADTFAKGSKLFQGSQRNALAAYELAVREGRARAGLAGRGAPGEPATLEQAMQRAEARSRGEAPPEGSEGQG